MGNQMCCDDSRKQKNPLEGLQPDINKPDEHVEPSVEKIEENEISSPHEHHHHEHHASHSHMHEHAHPVEQQSMMEVVEIPQLSYKTQNTLNAYNFYQEEVGIAEKHTKRFGGDVYVGPLDDQGKPNGFGKIYKQDGSLFIGQLLHGKAEGKGAFIFPDGSFYNGDFINNTAQSANGHYHSDEIDYNGGFKNNTFDGAANQKGKNYSFKGQYEDGHKTTGVLTWQSDNFQYIYDGLFNSRGQFHGSGVLTEPNGEYKGYFLHGLKEGDGIYTSKNGIVYRGQYRNNLKNGKGVIQKNNSVEYEGEFVDGVPHGKGWTYKKGQRVQAMFKDGVDVNFLN